ncbi:MAG: phosphoglycerate dehydrogenase [bacterium]
MRFDKIKIGVTSTSFSKDTDLRQALLSYFPRSRFNDKGGLLEKDALIRFLSNLDGAIIGRDPVDRYIIDNLSGLKVISKYGVGLDNIDPEILKVAGIHLGWTAGVNAYYVAELTVCFILGLLRNIFITQNFLKFGQWVKEGGVGLPDKIVGIIGCGHIGKEVVRLLQPFRCKILVNDIVDYTEYYERYHVTPVSFKEILRESKVISLHVPLDKSTYHMIDKDALALMSHGSFLINTSRGPCVNTADLKRALKTNTIAGAALDVYDIEPIDDDKLIRLPNLICTPHIGGNAKEAIWAMGQSAINHLVKFFSSY